MMKMIYVPLALGLAFAVSGCTRPAEQKNPTPGPAPTAKAPDVTDDAAAIRASLAKLSAEDRKLAEEQQFCAVESKNPLGSMGVPYKVMLNNQPVFLCCDGCETRAKAHADRTLAKVQQLREQRAKGEQSKEEKK